MKNIGIFVLFLCYLLVMIGIVGCSNTENTDLDDPKKSDNQLSQSQIPITEPISTTIKPVITEKEKAAKLSEMVQEYIDNGGNANYSIDEFNSSVVATFPDNDKVSLVRLKGDDNEDILLSGMISQGTEGDGASFLLMIYYIIPNGSPIDPKDLYVKINTESLTMSNFTRTDYDIGLGYISEMSIKLFTEADYNELLELKKVLEKGEVRMRISGSGNVDFTFPKKNGQLLIDSIDLFVKYLNDYCQ